MNALGCCDATLNESILTMTNLPVISRMVNSAGTAIMKVAVGGKEEDGGAGS
jgi:hypothetical protein